ncbi:MAG: flagellar biosynthesis anti-sigma factor FlgM [Thermoguttaceae bacterium]
MHIYGPAHLHGAQPVGPPHTARLSRPQSPSPSGPIQDELQISDVGRLVDQVRDLPEIRRDRVERIRAQIAQGTYETDEKLRIALERLLEEIG